MQALLVDHGGEVDEELGRHSTNKTVPRLIKRHFPERILPTEKKSWPTKCCVVCLLLRKESVLVS